MVCAHHHLYSTLARGMPAPSRTPRSFPEILELVWWRLDAALDLEMIRWSAMLGALEALSCGTTAIVDHHESPNAIEGSLDVIAAACAAVGVRVLCAYGVTDRHGPDGVQRGLEENRRFLAAGGTGMVGIHAAFTCSEETLAAAAGLAAEFGVGVHVHVAEDAVDRGAPERLRSLSAPDWVLAHGVHLDDRSGLQGTVVHNPRSNLNNAVGYARPARFAQPVALGTDGIGGDMLDEFRLAYVLDRSCDVIASPERLVVADGGLPLCPPQLRPVTWSYPQMEPWHLAYTTGVHPLDVEIDGRVVWRDGGPTLVDASEIRAKAAEQAERLFARL
jgi:cytosine/adenosine deaminase-related metal-dependent hydrolase